MSGGATNSVFQYLERLFSIHLSLKFFWFNPGQVWIVIFKNIFTLNMITKQDADLVGAIPRVKSMKVRQMQSVLPGRFLRRLESMLNH